MEVKKLDSHQVVRIETINKINFSRPLLLNFCHVSDMPILSIRLIFSAVWEEFSTLPALCNKAYTLPQLRQLLV